MTGDGIKIYTTLLTFNIKFFFFCVCVVLEFFFFALWSFSLVLVDAAVIIIPRKHNDFYHFVIFNNYLQKPCQLPHSVSLLISLSIAVGTEYR